MSKALKLANILIKETPILHLATSDKDGRPSNCALEFAEKNGSFYWRSGSGSEHSKNLTYKKTCSVCVTKTNPDGSGEGIQSLGTAVLIKDLKERQFAKKLLDKKITKVRSEATTSEEDTREYWAFIPKKLFYMNETVFGYGKILITRSK